MLWPCSDRVSTISLPNPLLVPVIKMFLDIALRLF
jgi:hypothetical protein